MPIKLPEFVENPEPRCPVILLCDTSDSMRDNLSQRNCYFVLAKLEMLLGDRIFNFKTKQFFRS